MLAQRCATGLTALALLIGPGPAGAAGCDLAMLATGPGRTPIHAAPAGVAAIYFRTDMDVNTDGAARSYHPDDPRGASLALNNIANAITAIYDASGRRVDCSPRRGECFSRYIATYEAARAASWNPKGHPRIETRDIIPWRQDARLGWRVPCTIASGPFAGYFVSQTSRPADPSRDECDQARYVDSLALNAIVLPRSARWASQGAVVNEFDLVAVRDRQSGQVRFAIVGDRGPDAVMGEGSIALTAALSGTTLSGQETYQQIKRLRRPVVDYVVFPTFDVQKRESGPVTQEKIDRLGEEAFRQWGGTERLDACRQQHG